MNTRWIPIVCAATLVVSSCDNDEPSTVNPPDPTTEELIIADCYVVRDALETFAAENGGVYPRGLNEISDAGHSFMSFLPGGTRMMNRHTGLSTAPVFYHPQWPGEVGVHLLPSGPTPVGFRVVGLGRDSELIRLENFTHVDARTVSAYDSVLANAAATAAAADEFRRQAGYCPSYTADQTPSGENFVDFLPGGTLMTNPFLGVASEPTDGSSSYAGNVGYVGTDRDGDGAVDSYIIEASGSIGAWLILTRLPHSEEDATVSDAALALRNAVELYASQNDGAYPATIDPVLGFASDFLNPYTGASAFRNGLATLRGEVGYLPVESGGVVVGYTINALGLFEEELERFEVAPTP